MAWKKIDDYNSGDTGYPEQPYSAFLAQGLTKNARSYPVELTRGACIPFLYEAPPKIASYGDPIGTVIWVNCGANASQINFRFFYSTPTNHAVESGRMGQWFVGHINSNRRSAGVDCLPSTTGSWVDIQIDSGDPYWSGYQAFWVGFQSEVLDDLGSVHVVYADTTSVGLRKTGTGAGHYPITTGEKWQLLRVDPTTVPEQPVEFELTEYQIGYLSAAASQDPEGIAVVFPGDPTYPNGNSVNDSTKVSTGNVYELGTVSVYSIAYEVTQGEPLGPPDQFNHYHAISLAGVNAAQTESIPAFRPEIANSVATRDRFGWVTNDPLNRLRWSFAVQSSFDGTLVVAFSVIDLSRIQRASTTFGFTIYPPSGAPIFFEKTFEWTQYRTAVTREGGTSTFRALNGITAARTGWGMRDGIPWTDATKGNQVFVEMPVSSFAGINPVEGVYAFEIAPGANCYIYAVSARIE